MVLEKHALTAQRFAGKPLRQPNYSMRDTPRCHKDLTQSTIGEINTREHFNEAMAEMVLLCNEVMRRKSEEEKKKEMEGVVSNDNNNNRERSGNGEKKKKTASKPLSLEYIADRCDVDDPIWGFIVRSDPSFIEKKDDSRIQKGMMQGFITVTTFTNWQESFRWDSMHDSAFSYDEPDMAAAMATRERKFDYDGSLAAEIQNTVRCGDPWNEGIVWPRVAEISLLGGLGCGKALLSLVIERLECMAANAKHNYDYVVLQATSNSIPFYEAMGFVRIGAVTKNNTDNKENDLNKPNEAIPASQIVSGPVKRVKSNEKETLRKFCSRLNVDVWDVVFLNKDIFPGISIKSVLREDTELFVPDLSKLDGGSNAEAGKSEPSSVAQWYDAKDNETPREISKKFDVCLKQLLAANKGRIQGLQAHSKLVEGTRLQVSNLDQHYDEYVPYCHWTFPDDKFENNEPSYMMVRKLNRKTRQEMKIRPIEDSIGVKVTPYESPSSIYLEETAVSPIKTQKSSSKKRKLHPDEPIRPKRPKSGYFFFLEAERERMKGENIKFSIAEFAKDTSVKWRELSDKEKSIFELKREKAVVKYEKEMKVYNTEMEKFKAEHPDWVAAPIKTVTPKMKKSKNLFNKVVRLNEEGRREAGTEFEYYYVLTYIPDLFWCHLAPMKKKGTFGSKYPEKVKGRPKWVLVGEDEGKELDISAAVCEVVRSGCLKRCIDADKEEWNILDQGETSSSTASETNTSTKTSKGFTKAVSSEESDVEDESQPKKKKQKKHSSTAGTLYSRLMNRVRKVSN